MALNLNRNFSILLEKITSNPATASTPEIRALRVTPPRLKKIFLSKSVISPVN